MSDLLRRLVDLEADVRYQDLARDDEEEFSYTPGRVPVLLSAPHGAVHKRTGKPKQEDEYTSGFARLIAGLTDAHVIYTLRKSLTDPNWYPDVTYKVFLRQIVKTEAIRFVLDIHGAAENHKFGIALGTIYGESCPGQREVIIRELGAHGFKPGARNFLHRIDVDKTFTAGRLKGQETITRFVWETLGVPAAQFELHPCLRVVERRDDATEKEPFHGKPELIEAAIQAFVALVQVLAKPLTM